MQNRFFYLLVFIITALSASAQEQSGRAITQKDGDVYLFQSKELYFGSGYNVYRQTADTLRKLNDMPLRAVDDGFAFQEALGEDMYQRLVRDLETDNPTATLLRLQNDYDMAILLAFTYPTAARALGFLFVDSAAVSGQPVDYKIEYVDSRGKPTGEILELTAPADPFIPNRPEAPELSRDENAVVVQWNMLADSPELIGGYNIYRRQRGTETADKINEGLILHTDEQPFADVYELPIDGKTYEFFVRAQDITGQESEPSPVDTLTMKDVIPPPPVQGVRTNVVKNKYVEISWSVNVAEDAKGYRVYRGLRSVDEPMQISNQLLGVMDTYFSDSTIEEGTKYAYRVTAVDSAGNESNMSNPSFAIVTDDTAPPVPSQLEATHAPEAKGVQLNWGYSFKPDDFRTFVIMKRIKQGEDYSNYSQVNLKALQTTNYMDTSMEKAGFPPGEIFEYGVAAMDSATNISDTVFVTFQVPDEEAPPAPEMLKARNSDGYRVALTYSASDANDVVSYRIYRRLQGKEDSLLAQVDYRTRTLFDTTVNKGNTYIYSISSLDSLGNESAQFTTDTLAMKDFNPPASVRNVEAEKTEEGVIVRWEASRSADLTGYRILKSDIPTGIYEELTSEPVSDTKFRDSEGKVGEWYKVVAYDTSGNKSLDSDPSQAVRQNSE